MCPIGLPVHSKAVGGVILRLPVLDKDINAQEKYLISVLLYCKKSACMKLYFVHLIKAVTSVLWFYSTQKRQELAGSGLALNYVIYSRTVKLKSRKPLWSH